MAKPQGKITKLDLRVPNEFFAKIEAKAIKDGAKIHHISGKPELSKIAVNLIDDGLRLYELGYQRERQDLIEDMQTELQELVLKLVCRSAEKLAKKLKDLDIKYTGALDRRKDDKLNN